MARFIGLLQLYNNYNGSLNEMKAWALAKVRRMSPTQQFPYLLADDVFIGMAKTGYSLESPVLCATTPRFFFLRVRYRS